MNPSESNIVIVPIIDDWETRSVFQIVVLMAATAFGVYLCYLMTVPFLAPLTWALALAVVFVPFQRRLEVKYRNTSVAAGVAVFSIFMIVVIPTIFVAQHLVLQAMESAKHIETKLNSGDWRRAIEAQPRLAPLVYRIEQETNLPETVHSLANWLSTTAGSVVKVSAYQLIGIFITFYFLFFILRDRKAAFLALRSLSPLSDAEMDRLIMSVGDTIYSTIYGTLVVAIVQGMLGGLMFWWLGLPAPLLWGVVMALLAVIPMFGAFIIWIPAALFLALDGHWGKAIILVLWGTLVVGTIDNLLYPMLVGNRINLHTGLAFIAVLGGLTLFGTAGLILGPVSLTITVGMLEIWRNRTTTLVQDRVLPHI